MRTGPLVFVLLLAAASARAEPGGQEPVYRGALAALFVPVSELPGRWEALDEATQDPAGDATFREAGVRAVAARHYTRQRGVASQVCSVEIWAFGAAGEAAAAAVAFRPPGWRVSRAANLLISQRGVTLERGRPFEKGLFPACRDLGERTDARARARLR